MIHNASRPTRRLMARIRSGALTIGLAVAGSPLFGAGLAHACDEPVALDPTQARELLTLIRDPEGDALDQIFAFETLMCAQRPAVRDLATRTAIVSPNPTLRASVMFEQMFAKEGVLVEYLPAEGLESNVYKFIKENPSQQFIFTGKTRTASCLSLYQADCSRDGHQYFVEISGTHVTLIYGDQYVGDFQLQGQELLGTIHGSKIVYERETLGAVPARVRLFD